MKVLVLGTGGHAKVAAEIARLMGLEVTGFLDDDPARHGETFSGARVLGAISSWEELVGGLGVEGSRRDEPTAALNGVELVGGPGRRDEPTAALSGVATGLVLGIGANAVRRDLLARYPDAPWVAVVHPSAIVSPLATIHEGAMIGAGAHLGPDSVVGRGAIVNTQASIDHDCVIEDFAHVAVGAVLAGTVTVGEGALVGAGSAVIQNLRIGAWATVGAGAAVVRDVPAGATVVGVPARPLER